MRRRLPWLVAVPLMVVGSLAAHMLTNVLVGVRAEGAAGAERDLHGVAERSSTGLASHLVLLLGLAAAIIVAAALVRLISLLRRRPGYGASPWLFFTLPPLAFSAQELIERVLHAEAAPFQAALEPRFLLGLALQVPLGLVALFAARTLLRVAERIVRALIRPRTAAVVRRPPVFRLPIACELPRIPALALGYPQRGPPLA